MPKVYIEHDDGHNEARILTFESEDGAIKHIWDAEGDVTGDEIKAYLFDVQSPKHCGEFHGLDKWSVFDWDTARSRSDYWAQVANQIARDEEVK